MDRGEDVPAKLRGAAGATGCLTAAPARHTGRDTDWARAPECKRAQGPPEASPTMPPKDRVRHFLPKHP